MPEPDPKWGDLLPMERRNHAGPSGPARTRRAQRADRTARSTSWTDQGQQLRPRRSGRRSAGAASRLDQHGRPDPLLTRRHRKQWALSLALVALVVGFGSLGTWAAWTVSNTNANNTFSTSSILLADTEGGSAGTTQATGTALFNVTGLAPGQTTTTKCIGVEYTGTGSALTLSATFTDNTTSTHALADALTINAYYEALPVTAGAGGAGACPTFGSTTTLASSAVLSSWANGTAYSIGGGSPPAETYYAFNVTLPSGAASSCNTLCNKTLTLTLTWTLTAT